MYSRSNKKYKKFFDEKSGPSKRIKFLFQTHGSSIDDSDLKGFLKENGKVVGQLLGDRFADFMKAKSSTKHTAQQDLEMLLFVLEAFVVHCLKDNQDVLSDAERWIRATLNHHNKHAVRLRGAQILMVLTQTLLNHSLSVESVSALFKEAVYFRPFHDLCRTPNLHESEMALCAATTIPTKDECIESLQQIIDFTIAKERSFESWFEILKTAIFPILYRDVCKELGIVEGNPEVQVLMIGTIERWVSSPVFSKVIWHREQNHGKITMEMFRQALRLPVEFQETILKAVELFHNIIVAGKTKAIPTVLGGAEQIQQYWQDYNWHMTRAFNIYSDSKSMSKHVELCNAVLDKYMEFAIHFGAQMTKETCHGLHRELESAGGILTQRVRIALQNTLLHCVCDTFENSTPFAVAHISAGIDMPLMKVTIYRREDVGRATGEADALLGLACNHIGVECALIVRRGLDVETYIGSQDKVLQLTYVLIDKLYVRVEKKESAAQKRKNDKINAEWERVEKKPDPVRDPAITDFEWSNEKIKHMWNTILHILGNVNMITDLANFTTAIQCLSQVVDLLMQAEDEQPLGCDPVMPTYEIFLPWLLEAGMIDEKRNRGRLVACGTLCRLFCRSHLVESIPPELYVYFYHVLVDGLSTQHSSIKWNIIRHSHNLFTLALPGSYVLIPHYLREIPSLFASKSVPENVQARAVSILMSLICVPNHFNELAIPYEGGDVTSEQIRDDLQRILFTAMESEYVSGNVRCDLIYAIMLVIMDDLANNVREKVVQVSLRCLMDNTRHPIEEVAKAAISAIGALTSQFSALRSLSVDVIGPLLSLLSSNVITLIKQGKDGDMPEDVIAASIGCMLDWALECKGYLLDTPELLDQYFVAVEHGLLGEAVSLRLSSQIAQIGTAEARESKSTKRRTKFLGMGTKSQGSMSKREDEDDKLQSMLDHLNEEPSHKSEKIREAAVVALMGMYTCFNNFPEPDGATEGKPAEQESSDAQFFVLNDSVVISFEQIRPCREGAAGETEDDEDDGGASGDDEGKGSGDVPKTDSSGSVADEGADKEDDTPADDDREAQFVSQDSMSGPPLVRVTIRDCTARVTWDCQFIDGEPVISHEEDLRARIEFAKKSLTGRKQLALDADAEKGDSSTTIQLPPYERAPNEIPQYHADKYGYAKASMVDETLAYIESTAPLKIREGLPYEEGHPSKVDEMRDLCVVQSKLESDAPISEEYFLPKEQEARGVPCHFHYCRLLMSHLGLLEEAYSKNLCFLRFGKRLKRSLKELDKVNGREMIKIGLIYVRDGQSLQGDILKNSAASKKYTEFVSGLGWSIHVPTHCGYKGGLDERSTGESAPYWCNALMEVIFHDITRMPTAEDDPQQIHKKRHVGNDSVHIVWSNNPREYSPMTVTSQFNDAHVVVYPMSNGLYRLQVFKKKKLPPFGPARDGMVVTKKLLPDIVRTTAINANTSARATQEVYKKPYPTRLLLIKQVIQRYKYVMPVEEFLSALFPRKGEHVADSPPSQRRGRPGSNRGTAKARSTSTPGIARG